MSKEKRSENEVGVIVEIRVKKRSKSKTASDAVRGIKTKSFKLDENY